MLAGLIRKGYVTRAIDPRDRRRAGLTLTRSGARVKEHNTVLDRDLVKQMLRPMPAAELERALAGIEKLAKYAEILLMRRQRARAR